MPKAKRDYIHCIRCHIPLEMPAIKRCETETWYIDFAVCRDCKKEMLAMENPSLQFTIDGPCLKTLLKTKHDECMLATVFPEKGNRSIARSRRLHALHRRRRHDTRDEGLTSHNTCPPLTPPGSSLVGAWRQLVE